MRYKILVAISTILLLESCTLTSNFYTGKVLDQGESVLSAAMIKQVKETAIDEGWNIYEEAPFAPLFGYSRGLPYNFEIGLRYAPPFEGEVNLRYQLPSVITKSFDVSINAHYTVYPLQYFRYGITTSRSIKGIEPSISVFSFAGNHSENQGLLDQVDMISIGIGIPIMGGTLIPELSVIDFSEGNDQPLITYGIGFRVK